MHYRHALWICAAAATIPTSCNFSGSSSVDHPGTSAPKIDADDLSGKRMKLSDFRGKVVLLDFWATY